MKSSRRKEEIPYGIYYHKVVKVSKKETIKISTSVPVFARDPYSKIFLELS